MLEKNSAKTKSGFTGQSTEAWNKWWEALTPESEIRRWDSSGLRRWILKYVPRHGKVIESGCGLGRWNFYLSELGIDIEGIDFSAEVVDYVNKWQTENNFSLKFKEGDVTELPYEDNSLGGYISLGVVEHFIEGPHVPLKEAYRVLRPGGIAIITTPSVSWLLPILKFKTKIKRFIKKIIGREVETMPFFQYEYRPKRLMKFVKHSGLYVSQYSGCDLLATFDQLGKYSGKNLEKDKFAYWFSERFENSFLGNFGSQSVTISVKLGQKMHCFFCGKKSALKSSLIKYSVPVCHNCNSNQHLNHYEKKKKPVIRLPYQINPDVLEPTDTLCYFCNQQFRTHHIFENHGFSKNTCSSCLKKPSVNLELSNNYIQPIWRKKNENI